MKFDDKIKELQQNLEIPADVIKEQDVPGTPAAPATPTGTPAAAPAEQLYDVFVVYRSDTRKAAFKGKYPRGTKLTISMVGNGKTADEAEKMLNNNPRFKI